MIRVVIADDEEHVCRLIQSLVDWNKLDMEIAGVAHNGVEALELTKELSPDLMITDIRMPGYDGLEMIKLAKSFNKNLDFIIISGYCHFEYAQSAIKYGVGDYLLKPIKKEDLIAALKKMRAKYIKRTERISNEERLKNRIKSDADKLRSNLFTERLLKKGITTEDLSIEKVNGNYHFLFKPGNFQVCAVKIDCGFEEDFSSAIKIFEEKILHIIKSLLSEYCFDIGIYFDDSITYCILNYEEGNLKFIHKHIRAVLDELMVQKAVFEKFDFTVCVGMPVNNISRLKESFSAANFAIGQRLLLGTGKLIDNSKIYKDLKTERLLLSELSRSLSGCLEVLNRDGALSCIEDFKSQISAASNLSGQQILSMVKNVYQLYLIIIRNNQIEAPKGKKFNDNFYIYANRCSSVDQLFEFLSKTIAKSLDLIIEDKKQEDTRPIRLAKQYIKDNYMKHISLEEVSGYVGFNPTYFSTLFKKENGSNFVDYLTEVRMDNAKFLLKETNKNISGICELVGYNDIKHFTKSFKKNTGLKPNEYRKLYS